MESVNDIHNRQTEHANMMCKCKINDEVRENIKDHIEQIEGDSVEDIDLLRLYVFKLIKKTNIVLDMIDCQQNIDYNGCHIEFT